MPPTLVTPLPIREVTLPNRLMVAPMCQYSVEDEDGLATDWHMVHLGSRAVGGAGLVMTEATAVEPRGRITPQDLGIWSDAHGEALEPIAAFIRSQGAVPGIQLAHAGRKASTTRPSEGGEPLQPDEGGWEVVAPSAEPWPHDEQAPETHRLTVEAIEGIVDAFAEAAARADRAGFQVAEIHAAHGYLLHEFLSPVTNHRDDVYGGSFENRTRILREVVDAVRERWPEAKPLFVRFSGTDWLPDEEAWTIEQTTRVADQLFARGVDLVDISSGGIQPEAHPPWVGPGYQLRLAEHVIEHRETDVRVGTVGGLQTAEQAEELLCNGRADLCIVGRAFLRNPYLGVDMARSLGYEDRIEPARQYQRAYR